MQLAGGGAGGTAIWAQRATASLESWISLLEPGWRHCQAPGQGRSCRPCSEWMLEHRSLPEGHLQPGELSVQELAWLYHASGQVESGGAGEAPLPGHLCMGCSLEPAGRKWGAGVWGAGFST